MIGPTSETRILFAGELSQDLRGELMKIGATLFMSTDFLKQYQYKQHNTNTKSNYTIMIRPLRHTVDVDFVILFLCESVSRINFILMNKALGYRNLWPAAVELVMSHS